MPIGIGGFLPGKLYYYNIKKNEWAKPKLTIDKANNREPIISDNIKDYKGHYLSFYMDNNGLVESLSYLVKKYKFFFINLKN